MPLPSGTHLGPYEVLALIGVGGMGEVYRARDTRLDRYVAIKVLAAHQRPNELRAERFEREARAISRLNHPHICTLYDVGVQSSIRFLVMELVEGQRLDARLLDGPLKLPDAMTYAAQILDALECAHQNGVVHRDLKPANIIVTASGVKLLDFGIAKWRDEEDNLLHPRSQPADTITASGQIVGTLPYMAPEQLENGEIDARTDIFAFGVIAFEMLTGTTPFQGRSRASLVAAVLEHEPGPLSQRDDNSEPVSAALERVIYKCLAKSADARWQTVRDLRDELRWLGMRDAAPEKSPRRWGRWLPAAGAVALVVGAAMAVTSSADRPPPALTRFTVQAPSGYALANELALSRDGRSVVFSAVDANRVTRLAVRAFDSLEAHILPDTQNAEQPFWSPDGREIGFFADRTLKVLSRTAETARRLAYIRQPSGATWGIDGTILFAPDRNGVLYTISSLGTVAAPLTELASDETSHANPRFINAAGAFLFTTGGAQQRLVASALDSSARTNILNLPDRSAAAIGGDHLVYVRNGVLVAQRLARGGTEMSGAPVPLTDRIAGAPAGALDGTWFDATETTLALLRPAVAGREFVWVDRAGRVTDVIDAADDLQNPDLSPDGSKLIATRMELDVNRHMLRLLDLSNPEKSTDLEEGSLGAWSPDGHAIAFRQRTRQNQPPSLLLRRISAESSQPLATDIPTANANVQGWSPDGRFVLYSAVGARTDWDIWMVPTSGDRRPQALLQSPAAEPWAAVSPDGRWLAYASNESGQLEVYVRRFPDGSSVHRVSHVGGAEPRWRRDGRELYYVRGPEIISVPVLSSDPWATGPAVPLFAADLSTTSPRTRYLPSAEGQRFLLVRPRASTVPSTIEIIVNWQTLLDRN